jgi:hypothetical protein
VRGAERRVSARAKRARAVACSRRSLEASSQRRVSARSCRRQRSDLAAVRRAAFDIVRKRRRSVEAAEWPFDDSADGVFSFRNVCEVLGIDGCCLNSGLSV